MKEGHSSSINYNISYCFYLPAVLYYCLILIHDLFSNTLLLLTLISITCFLHPVRHKALHLGTAIVNTADLVYKGLLVLGVIPPIGEKYLDLSVVNNLLNSQEEEVVHSNSLIYLLILVLSWLMAYNFKIINRSKRKFLEELKFLEFLSNALEYIIPFLLYALCYTRKTSNHSFREWFNLE